MTRRRRALALAVLAIVLGTLAATNVSSREAALRRRLGPSIPVVVARADIRSGAAISARSLAVRRVPARYAPSAGYTGPEEVVGQRASVAIPAGTDIVPAFVMDAATTTAAPQPRRGERLVDLVAEGSAPAGSRVDVLVTTERPDGSGHTRLALQDAAVLASSPVSGGRVRVTFSVSVREAIRLAAAQNFAREIRVLPRAAGDDARYGG